MRERQSEKDRNSACLKEMRVNMKTINRERETEIDSVFKKKLSERESER